MDESNNPNKYAYLDQLSTEELKEILRADVELPESGNEGVILYILEVINQREKEDPTVPAFDVKAAREEFQKYYNVPEGDGLSLYPMSDPEDEPDSSSELHSIRESPAKLNSDIPKSHRRRRALIKWLVPFAAAFIILLGGMITAQAAGWDVFGTLLRWTDETFHFVTRQNMNPMQGGQANPSASDAAPNNSQELHDVLQDALDECGITEPLAPTWFPDGCTMVSDPKIIINASESKIACEYFVDKTTFFAIRIRNCYSTFELDLFTGEWDSGEKECYPVGNMSFYIMTNNETLTAVWSDNDSQAMILSGNISIDVLKEMLKSTGV